MTTTRPAIDYTAQAVVPTLKSFLVDRFPPGSDITRVTVDEQNVEVTVRIPHKFETVA
jgi:hypothetical protein